MPSTIFPIRRTTSPTTRFSETLPSELGINPEIIIEHVFRPAEGAIRSPCPALNALANHSYLPHDGRNVTFTALFSSLRAGFGLSRGFALFMTIGTFTLLRRPFLIPFDLRQCSRHNFIEHDASMVHDDAPLGTKYAPTEVNPALLRDLLAKAHPLENSEGEMITMKDIAQGRVERETACAPIGALHSELARGEFAMVIEIFGKGRDKHLTKHDLEVFLGEDRFPEAWTPSSRLRLRDVVVRSQKMKNAMKRMKLMETERRGDEGGSYGREWMDISSIMDDLEGADETLRH